jgi:hypothetical protein
VLAQLLVHLLGNLIVLSRLGAVGLRGLPMFLCLAAVHLDIAQTQVCQVVVQQCGRVMYVGAGPGGRGRVFSRPLRLPPGLLGKLVRMRGLVVRRPPGRVIRSCGQTVIATKAGQAVPRFLSPLACLIGALAGLGCPAGAPLTVRSVNRLTHERSMTQESWERPTP